MHTLSYTVSPVLQQRLNEIEILRQKIVLFMLPPLTELELCWEANLSRIYYSLHLAHNPVTKRDIYKALTMPVKANTRSQNYEIIGYKRGLDYIRSEWLVNNKPIMPQAIRDLYKSVLDSKPHAIDATFMEILVFLQTSREHPLVQGFISYTQFMLSNNESDASGKIARLVPYMFLYKAGLDYRGLLVLEKYFYDNERLLKEMIAAINRNESISVWIEHFVQSVATDLDEVYQQLLQAHSSAGREKILRLTERQKEILSVFDQPGMRITNRKVQQAFRISQITASRDLSGLAALGLLFPYGKGRSVYYIRA